MYCMKKIGPAKTPHRREREEREEKGMAGGGGKRIKEELADCGRIMGGSVRAGADNTLREGVIRFLG